MSLRKAVARFWARHKRAILVLLALYVVLLVILTILASGPQNEPFIYQAH